MIRVTQLNLPLEYTDKDIEAAILKRLKIAGDELLRFTIFKISPDARKRSNIRFVASVDAEVADESAVLARFEKKDGVYPTPDMTYRFSARAPAHNFARPIIVGAGPAGLFAALILAQSGFRPIILERGKIVRERTKDTFGFWRGGAFHPESNAQFGEGGAGTFSDGKLYSRIADPEYYGRKVLEEFVAAGAKDEILRVNRPHIGTFRLVTLVENIRAQIESLGGEYRFETRMTDLVIEGGLIRAVRTSRGDEIACDNLVLALGHSSRDTFAMLLERGVAIEPKAFSIGVRMEHPQALIDAARFGKFAGNPRLGAADYSLVHHCANGRSVYSFCMCPGGLVLAATSEEGCVVTNGMSQYSRSERNANSGIVVGLELSDLPPGPLGGIDLQRKYERLAFELGGGDYRAPAQLLGDFLADRPSKDFGSVIPSYTPAVKLGDIAACLPDFVAEAMREALVVFDTKIKGYAMPDAVLTAVETRTSSPVRITRDRDSLESVSTRGVFPSGEGAGYAGGILSAAVDGIRVAEAVARRIAG